MLVMTRTSPDEHLAEWLLDRDGDLYGDERERVRWYEAIAVTSSVQSITIPWALAVAVWVADGKAAASALLAVAVAFYLPLFWSSLYVQRHGVRVYGKKWTTKRLITTVLFVVPYALFFIGRLDSYTGLGGDFARGAWFGAVIGLAAAAVGIQARRRREAARESTPEDLD
jgi:hypothetical protein